MDDLGGKPTIFGNIHMGQVWILVFSKYLPPFTTIHAVCFEKPVVFVSSKFQVFKGSKCQVGRIFWFVPSTKMAIPRITGDFHPFIAPLLTESPWRGQGQDLEWWVPEKKGEQELMLYRYTLSSGSPIITKPKIHGNFGGQSSGANQTLKTLQWGRNFE